MSADIIRHVRLVAASVLAITLAACATDSEYAPASAHRPWTPPSVSAQWRALAVDGASASSPQFNGGAQQPKQDQAYDLPALIDIAQFNNPLTRVAWSQARQAASGIGLTEAAYLPMLSANVMGGYVSTRWRLPEVLDERLTVRSSANGVAAGIGLEWLLFDFGQRDATHEAARNLSIAANFSFNAVHQQLAYEVANAYYAFGAARQRSRIAVQALRNSEAVLAAAEARRKSGLATTVEVAQARQQVAQSQLQRVTAEGAQRNAYQVLLDKLGLPYGTVLQVADSTTAPLPSASELPAGAVLQRALADRPDVLASVASLKAAESGVDAARAAFAPKVFLAGFAVGGNEEVALGPIAGLANNGSARAIFLGMSMPIYDGGLRSARLHDARERVNAARATLDKLRAAAISEIVVANNLLENALASYEAATTLVETARITYDAAFDSYKQGLGTVTVATEAANGLLAARSAQTDAHAAALSAAAALALALGKIDQAFPQQNTQRRKGVPRN
ncbi:TolC family protein [Bordetella sp. 02P26C-1]|uniref:TolC family protein n=1 Tax=Bordetella sp. 02P26C-1 TaxID=2683195 RepID=UPI001352B568|nr:TolC family protein [Bordetella sp. 02P26C-1]MVW77707.1 TolC family protein [Bordetella sp. 02P26C-1]